MIYKSVLNMIGNTPLLQLKTEEGMAKVYIKLENFNPAGSIKDRAALGMIEKAEADGRLKNGSVIVEPTSGNTGIGLAMIGRLKGYRVIIIMPDTMSLERRNMIKAYGAELILTPGKQGMKGAIEKAKQLVEENDNFFMPNQFANEANPQKHYETTGEEILKDLPEIDAFVAGVGTGGTLIGVGKYLKENKEGVKVYGVEPYSSSVLNGEMPGPHKIQGIGAGFIPDIYNEEFVDDVFRVKDDEAIEAARNTARENGMLIGISAGANVSAAIELAKVLGEGKTIVTVAPDVVEKYLSTGLYD